MLAIVLILVVLVAVFFFVNIIFSGKYQFLILESKIVDKKEQAAPVKKVNKPQVVAPVVVIKKEQVGEEKKKKSMAEKKIAKKQKDVIVEKVNKIIIEEEIVDDIGFETKKEKEKKPKNKIQKKDEIKKPKTLFKEIIPTVEQVVEQDKPVKSEEAFVPTVITQVYVNADDFWGGNKIPQPKKERKVEEGGEKKEFKKREFKEGEKGEKKEFKKREFKDGEKEFNGEKKGFKKDGEKKEFKKDGEKKGFKKDGEKKSEKKVEKKPQPIIATVTIQGGKSWDSNALLQSDSKTSGFPTFGQVIPKTKQVKVEIKHEKRSDHAVQNFEANYEAPVDKKAKIEENVVEDFVLVEENK